MTRADVAAAVRNGWGAMLRRVNPQFAVRLVVATSAASVVVIAAYACLRARLPEPAARQPTAYYTRPTPWGAHRAIRPSIMIGTVDGAPAEERLPVRLQDTPIQLVDAVLAVEDQRFFQHHGLDVKRIAGALIADLKARGVAQGGSTLTQQLAKNLFLNADRTPVRKLWEMIYALALEARYSKTAILEAYLNEIYLGQDGARAIHGVGAAARYYFGKDVRRLSLAESALLAATINAPNRNAPTRHADQAEQRRDLVLQLMADQHRISNALAAQAASTPIPERAHPASLLDGRYFRDAVQGAAPANLPARGGRVYTTLDASLQRAAERAVTLGVTRMHDPDVQASLVAIDPRTGDVLAMVGGRDYSASQFNRAVFARRQPGSAFKPIVALSALQRNGDRQPQFTLASVVDDAPLQVATPSGSWEPSDYDGSYRGPVTMREAMEQSLNIPFARIGLAVGPQRIVATAHQLGINSRLEAVPSVALGSSEVTLLELVRAYGVFADGGNLAPTRMVLGASLPRGNLTVSDSVTAVRVVDPATSWLVTSMLEGVVERGTGRALTALGHEGAVAGKTGTSNNWRDAWFIAYSSSLAVGVWVGHDDGRSLGLTGAGAALPIVEQFLASATTEDDWTPLDPPDGITEADVASASNPESCGEREYFLQGTEPSESGCGGGWTLPDVPTLRAVGGSIEQRARELLERWIGRRLQRLARRGWDQE